MALQYFVLNDWIFKNQNFASLTDQLRYEDNKSFGFREFATFDVQLYLRYALLGVKKYLLGDKEENMERNRIVYQRLKVVDNIIKSIPYVVTFYYIFIKYDFVHVCKSYFVN